MLPLSLERSRRTVDKLDVSHLKVQIPRLIFFPECKSPGGNPPHYCQEKRVRVTALTFEPSRSIVLVDFSNGRQQQFPAAISFLSGGKQSLRARVAIKCLASWLLVQLGRSRSEHDEQANEDEHRRRDEDQRCLHGSFHTTYDRGRSWRGQMTIVALPITHNFAPQYLQHSASGSCPSAPHAGHDCLVIFCCRTACASSTETMPVGTAMMP